MFSNHSDQNIPRAPFADQMNVTAHFNFTHLLPPTGNNSTSTGGTSTETPFLGQFEMDCVFRPTVENYLMIFAFCVIFCLSVVGNSIVVVVILQQRSMRSVTNLYLLNLALSDLLLSVVCMPPTLVSSLVYCWVFGDLLCKLLAYLQPVVVTASAYTLAAIALERYYAICKPLHSRVWHTRTHAMLVISLVWLVSVIANVFMLFMYEERTYNRTGLNCAPKFEPIVHFTYQIYMTVVLLVIPLVTMTLLYANVISTLRGGIRMDIAAVEIEGVAMSAKSNNNNNNTCENGTNGNVGTETERRIGKMNDKKESVARIDRRRQTKKDSMGWRNASWAAAEQSLRSTHSGKTAVAKQRLIRMLIVIVVIFFCCWTPSYIWWLLLNAQDSFGTFNIWNSELNTLITVLTYLSSCTNPITYCFLNNKFRNALFLTFGFRSSTRTLRGRFHHPPHKNNKQEMQMDKEEENGSAGSNNEGECRKMEQKCTVERAGGRKKTANCCLELLIHTKQRALSSFHNGHRISSHGRPTLMKEVANEMKTLNEK